MSFLQLAMQQNVALQFKLQGNESYIAIRYFSQHCSLGSDATNAALPVATSKVRSFHLHCELQQVTIRFCNLRFFVAICNVQCLQLHWKLQNVTFHFCNPQCSKRYIANCIMQHATFANCDAAKCCVESCKRMTVSATFRNSGVSGQ